MKKVIFGHYIQGENHEDYPLVWDVIEDDGIDQTLLSDMILEYTKYGKDSIWETSRIRKWLNCQFYDYAFSRKEKNIICTLLNCSNAAVCEDKVSLPIFGSNIPEWAAKGKWTPMIKQRMAGDPCYWFITPSIKQKGLITNMVNGHKNASGISPETSSGIRPMIVIRKCG